MISLENTILWLWLHQKVRLSRSKQHKLLEHFGSIERIYKAGLADYVSLGILREDEINLLIQKDTDECSFCLENMGRQNIRVVTCDSEHYPERLKATEDYPTVLYMRGKFIDLNNFFTVAMVGTRKATNYGKTCAHNLAKDLSLSGAVVVSGMALGIDTYSHEGALSAGKPTVAVIACGVDIPYPRQNASLMKKIMENGMVISEYPPGTVAERYYFPERNRIISGLCLGTLVVEADFKSGSLITAKCATEQNRDVFAVPGPINSVYSKGTNYLLKDGAKVVTCAEDILSCYRLDYPHLFKLKTRSAKKAVSCPKSDSIEDRILFAIGDKATHIDDICTAAGLDAGTVNASLLMMELGGKVIKLPGGFYSGI